MNKKISVLMVGYEAAPFYKRGGLGDVMESLPKALYKIGVDARIVIPYYSDIGEKKEIVRIGEFYLHFDGKEAEIGVYRSVFPGTQIPVYFLRNKQNLSRIRRNGKNKEIDQFAFFSLAAANLVRYLSSYHKWTPSVVHCNDWHTALIPLILKQKMKSLMPTLMTIHNLLYQGVGSLRVLDLLGIKDEDVRELKRGKPAKEINILGEGIIHASRVSTVSVSYAREIANDCERSPIEPFLKKREEDCSKKDGKIVGILNGIDCDIWNPEKDELIFHKFGISSWEIGKKDNKEDLLRDFGLQNKPTFCFVGRMATQKGLDVLIKTLNRISHFDVNVILLGSGSPKIQASVLKIAKIYSWVKAELVYDEELAHKIYAGSDFIIVPSRYEPCGLIQMIAMRYGTLPIASDTGGLRDSILNGKDGFLFKKGQSARLRKAMERALNRMRDKDKYRKMVERAMKKDFSWDKSAVLYKKLYEEMISQNSNLKSDKL